MQPLSPRGQLVIRYADALIRDRNAYFDELAVWKYRVHSTMFVASATILTLVCSLGRPISGNPGGTHACYPDCTGRSVSKYSRHKSGNAQNRRTI